MQLPWYRLEGLRPRRSWLWGLLALPALAQLVLLAVAFARRYVYPYDLEWMEGGMLTHALQLAEGRSIYRAPSVEFIPYLYTPLYPALLAGLGQIFGLTYQLGRAISIVSTVLVLAFAARAVTREAGAAGGSRGATAAALGLRGPARVGAACALGLFAACFPWVECFYDLVRGDSLFLAMGVGGLLALRAWAPLSSTRGRGFLHARVAAAAAILALSFFAKQTGVLFVAAGGAALVLMNWRAVPLFVAVAGAIGLGGSALLSRATGGWSWVYTFQVHQNHDTHMPRFWESFGHILGHFPVLSALVALGLAVVAIYASAYRRLPAGGAGFLYWAWMFACGTVIGAIGWSTQWAVFNAFIPAMALGAIAAGAAVVPMAAAIAELPWPARSEARAAQVAAALVLVLLGGQLLAARWDPRWSANVGDRDARAGRPQIWSVSASVKAFVPTAKDRAAGDRLVARLVAIDGDVFFPSHPWYPRLAGKRATFAHRIGVKDVTYELPCQVVPRSITLRARPGRKGAPSAATSVLLPCLRRGPELPAAARRIAGLEDAARTGRFAAVVLDHGESLGDYPGLGGVYRLSERLPGDASPRVFSGKPTAPGVIYRRPAPAAPAAPAPPAPPPTN